MPFYNDMYITSIRFPEICPGLISINRGNWMVIIDAAKGSTTAPPDLSKYKADFVVVSFYKVYV